MVEHLRSNTAVRRLLIGVLAATATILFALYSLDNAGSRSGARSKGGVRSTTKEIDAVVDTLLGRYGINPAWIRTWHVGVRGAAFARVERRVWVPPGFIAQQFNHELNQLLLDQGARVVGLERTAEGKVTLHILQNGLVVESLSLVLNHDLEAVP